MTDLPKIADHSRRRVQRSPGPGGHGSLKGKSHDPAAKQHLPFRVLRVSIPLLRRVDCPVCDAVCSLLRFRFCSLCCSAAGPSLVAWACSFFWYDVVYGRKIVATPDRPGMWAFPGRSSLGAISLHLTARRNPGHPVRKPAVPAATGTGLGPADGASPAGVVGAAEQHMGDGVLGFHREIINSRGRHLRVTFIFLYLTGSPPCSSVLRPRSGFTSAAASPAPAEPASAPSAATTSARRQTAAPSAAQ